MTIDEAIEEIRKAISYAHFTYPSRTAEALELGIEALKYIQRARQHDLYVKPERLPGETEE